MYWAIFWLSIHTIQAQTPSFELAYWIDSSRQANLEQAQKQTYLPASLSTNLLFVSYPVWVKMKVSPSADLIEVQARVDTLVSFQQDAQGVWQKNMTGDRLPFKTRLLDHYNLAIPLTQPSSILEGEVKKRAIYLCFKTHTQVRLRVLPQTALDFQKKNANNTLFYGFLYGVMALMFVYNLFFWWIVRDEAYLYYLGFSFFLLLVLGSQHLYQYVLGNFPLWNNNGVYYWLGMVNFCSANFGRVFLDTKQYAPRLGKILWYASFYGFVVMFCTTFFSFSFTSRFIFAVNPAYSLFLCISGVIVWTKGNRFAKYYVLAWLAYFGGILTLALHNQGIIGYSFWVTYAIEISTLLEVVILTLAMSYKYKIINEEAQQNKLENQALAYQKQIKEEENKHLHEKLAHDQAVHEEMVAFKDRELATLTMQMLEKNAFIHDIQKQLQRIADTDANTTQQLKNIGKTLKESLDLDEDWDKFRLHFEQVHPVFFQRLASQYPQLTAHDQKTLAYLRINLNSKDLARVLNIDVKSVKMLKYRLKKKLNLTEDMDVESFIKSF